MSLDLIVIYLFLLIRVTMEMLQLQNGVAIVHLGTSRSFKLLMLTVILLECLKRHLFSSLSKSGKTLVKTWVT